MCAIMRVSLTSLCVSARNNILIGLLLTAPIVATIWIFNFIFKHATEWFASKLFLTLPDPLRRSIVLLGILVVLCVLGTLARNFVGRRLLEYFDKTLSRIPLFRNVYGFFRQISDWLAARHADIFQEVVLIEYPRKGLYAIAFVTTDVPDHLRPQIPTANPAEPCLNVFLPTTPNPTSGFFLILPRSEVIPLNLDVASAINLVMSAGAILPQGGMLPRKDTFFERLSTFMHRHEPADAAKRDASAP